MAADNFGFRVALSGDTALVGAVFDDDAGSSSGSAYVFVKPDGGWVSTTETVKLTASDAVFSDAFGISVALSGDTTLVGAIGVNCPAGSNCGAAYINRFPCAFSGAVAASRWRMVSMPCDLGAAYTVADVFGDNFVLNDYQTTWVVYRRDEATDRYILQGPTSVLSQDAGYWLFSLSSGYWEAEGSLTTFVQSANCASPKGCYEVDLTSPDSAAETKFNLVGNPVNVTFDWGSARLLVDGLLYTPDDADFNGSVNKTIYTYNGASYDAFDDITPGMIGSLNAYQGFWVELLGGAFGKTVKLFIPNGQSIGAPPGPPGLGWNLPESPLTEKSLFARLLDFFIPGAEAAKPTWNRSGT